MRRLALLAFLLLALAGGAVIGLYQHGKTRFHASGPLAEPAVVIIPKGAGLERIARLLEDEGVVENRLIFAAGVRVLDQARALRAGEYAFPAAVSMRQAMEIIISGKTVVHRITLPEGQTSAQLRALLEAVDALAGELSSIPPEGSLLPETYHFSRGDSRQALLDRMRASMTTLLAELWPKRAADLPLKSPEEAVILASIVEKETAVAEERPLIAGVFINRLNKGMRLQSDPTVAYGLTLGRMELGRPLTRKDLQTPSPYNTYTIDRLPPGPIANPGRAALEAVLQPADTDFLYFVADGEGGHAFAKTLEEHNRNVAKWRKAKKAQEASAD